MSAGAVTPTALYRMRDSGGRLLYVGISKRLPERLTEHRKSKPWWSQVARIDIEHFADVSDAIAAEAKAIRSERPLWNVHHARSEPSARPRTRIVTVIETAALLGVSPKTVITCISQQDLPAADTVRGTLLSCSSIELWLEACSEGGDRPPPDREGLLAEARVALADDLRADDLSRARARMASAEAPAPPKRGRPVGRPVAGSGMSTAQLLADLHRCVVSPSCPHDAHPT